MFLERCLVTPEKVEAAVLRARGGSAAGAGAAVLLELAWAGAARRQLAALTSAAVSWPPSATLRALPRPDIVLHLPSKDPRSGAAPLRPTPEAAAWIAQRSKAAPDPEPLFTEAMFRSALRALRAEVGERVVLRDLRRSAVSWFLLRAPGDLAGNATGAAPP